MKVLFVDDSENRVDTFKVALSRSSVKDLVDVEYCDSADKARIALRQNVDLLVLDILLPKKANGTPQAKYSVDLLSDICNPKKSYIRPRIIIGLTADIAGIGKYAQQFAEEASIVIDGRANQSDWVEKITTQIEKLVEGSKKQFQLKQKSILISIHGIRTFGQWQAKFSDQVEKFYGSFECVEIKYGFFDLLSFAIPYLREHKVRKISERVLKVFDRQGDHAIFMLAHSFGTLIAANVLGSLESRRVSRTIFCGSPISCDKNIDKIVEASELTINECGTRDYILILARLFIWGLGDAGRIGFRRENSGRFINRYFSGGHDLYFKEYRQAGKFYEQYWLKILGPKKSPERVDLRKNYFGKDFTDIGWKVAALVKPLLCLLPFSTIFGTLYYIYIILDQYVLRWLMR